MLLLKNVLRTISFLLLLIGVTSQAAIDKHSNDKDVRTSRQAKSLKETLYMVNLPLEKSINGLVRQGRQGYKNLSFLAFDKQRQVKVRWRALNRLARVGQEKSMPILEKAIISDEWFMRNAALVAAKSVDRQKAKKWARMLLKDKALVIRTSAVGMLTDLRDYGSIDLLWEQLHDEDNFHKGKSLWIRKKITKSLAALAAKKDIKKFIGLLDDQDSSLQKPAIRALERLTKKRLGNPDEPIKFKVSYWKDWWSQKNKKSL